jgi:hypothetical protein
VVFSHCARAHTTPGVNRSTMTEDKDWWLMRHRDKTRRPVPQAECRWATCTCSRQQRLSSVQHPGGAPHCGLASFLLWEDPSTGRVQFTPILQLPSGETRKAKGGSPLQMHQVVHTASRCKVSHAQQGAESQPGPPAKGPPSFAKSPPVCKDAKELWKWV